jgi:biopolymer transport protein ExbB/TolQ
MNRFLVGVASIFAGIAIVAVLNLALEPTSLAGRLLVDKGMEKSPLGEELSVTRPFAVQTFMWIAFMFGIGEVSLRLLACRRERAELDKKYLPEAPDVLLTAKDLVPIYRRVHETANGLFLSQLIERTVLQFQTSKSVDRANSMLSSSIDLFMHEIDLRYNLLRFTVWLVPTLGFLGTVIGIVAGLNLAAVEYTRNNGQIDLASVTDALGAAFYTTWLGLLMSAILVFLMHIAQEIEEGAVNKSGQYCLNHLINKLYEK